MARECDRCYHNHKESSGVICRCECHSNCSGGSCNVNKIFDSSTASNGTLRLNSDGTFS